MGNLKKGLQYDTNPLYISSTNTLWNTTRLQWQKFKLLLAKITTNKN